MNSPIASPALPPLPEPDPMVLPTGWVRYTAAQMQDYARAALAQLGTGSGAGAQSDSGADSGHFARAVQSEGSTSEAPGWRPIDTAPKDGRWIACIGHLSNNVPDTVRWLVDGWNDGYTREDSQPTHWMPLPPAPAALAKVEGKEKTR